MCFYMVLWVRLELTRLSALEPKSSAATNYATRAMFLTVLKICVHLQTMLQCWVSITPFCNCVKLFFYSVAKTTKHPC